MGIPNAVAAMSSGSIDGALAAGPLVQKAMESGARVLFDGEGLVEGTILIGISGEALKDIPDLSARMKKVHNKALAYANEHPEESLKIVSEETELTPDQVNETLKLYDFDPEIRGHDIEELKKTMTFLVEAGLARKYVDPASLITR